VDQEDNIGQVISEHYVDHDSIQSSDGIAHETKSDKISFEIINYINKSRVHSTLVRHPSNPSSIHRRYTLFNNEGNLIEMDHLEEARKFDGPILASQSATGDGSDQSLTVLKSPMPCKISSILVKVGVQVKKGQTLMVLEAMKMEHAIKAPSDGKVTKFTQLKVGDLVEEGKVLVQLEPLSS
jgi:biotin carboxyl carrier protein